jgi:PAS domain S-box-containing protein
MNRFKENSGGQSLSNSTTRFWKQAGGLALIATAYWVAVRLGLLLVAQPEGVASIWPASGLALAVLLLNPKRQWAKLLAVIFVTNALGNLTGGNSLTVSLGFALANTFETFLGAWVLIYFCGTKITLRFTLEIFALFGVAVISNGITAILGATVAVLSFGAPFANTWLVWWASDGLGIILVAPLIVTWATGQSVFQSTSPRRLVESILVVLGLIGFAWLLFGPFTVAEEPVLRNYMLFPILIWLAFRYSPRGMTSVLVLLAVIAIWYTLQGHGIFAFANQDVTEHLVAVQMLLCVVSFSSLFLSSTLTELKQAEESRRESEDKFKYVFDNSSVGKSITLPTGEINTNKTFADMFGYTREELQNKKWQEITHPDDIELTQRNVDQLISGEQGSVRFNKRYIHKNGSVVWVDLSSAIRHDKDGKALYFITSVIDITERKRAELALRETSEHLSHMLANSPTVIYSLKVEGKTANPMWISDNIETVLGFSPEDALQPEWWIGRIYPEDRPGALASLEHILDDFYEHEYRFLCKDDSLIWLHDERCLLRGAENKPYEVVGAWTDITTLKQAEEALKEYNTRLETAVEARTSELREAQEQLVRQEKLAVLGQLAGSVGHELRNPLAVINNALYYLKLVGANGNEKVKEYLGIIQTETNTAEKIITDLLDFARIKSLDLEPVSVSELIRLTFERFPVPSSLDQTLEIPTDLPKVFVDPRQMVQVLGNLVVNACQSMSSTGSSTTGALKGGHLTISVSAINDFIAIAVQDTGMGISAENIQKIFEPLFTTKAKGIGLGLSVSQKLVKANGGRIEVKSEVGKGSTFTIFLPIHSGVFQ